MKCIRCGRIIEYNTPAIEIENSQICFSCSVFLMSTSTEIINYVRRRRIENNMPEGPLPYDYKDSNEKEKKK